MTRRVAGWASAVAATALIVGALTGCGSAPTRTAAHARLLPAVRVVGALCRHSSGAVMARVAQVGEHPARPEPGGSGGPWGVVTGLAAQSLALAVCALPPMPPGTYHCPELLFEAYRVVFVGDGRAFPPVTVQGTGCREVTGLGRVRSAVHAEALLEKLARIATGTQYFGPVLRD